MPGGLCQMYVRRRPTLPQPLGCSTIGAERLNFRVRYGTGCFPFRYGRRNSFNLYKPPSIKGCGFVGWELRSGREHHVRLVRGCLTTVCTLLMHVCVVVYVVGTSPRPMSTGRLGITAVHLRPINPMFCGGPYPLVWWETSS